MLNVRQSLVFRCFFFHLCVFVCLYVCLWLQAAAGTMTGCASASLLTAPQPQKHHCHLALSLSLSSFCFISVFFSLPTPCPLESADGTFFAERKRHTQAWAVEGDVVDKGKDVLLFYKGCSCLLRIDSLNWLPKPSFSPYISPSFYYTAHSGFLFYGVSGHS